MGSRTTDILLVGKTGYGKSATANTLVGYKAFQSKTSFTSVTKSAQFEYGDFEGRILKVVDGPGICDTSLDNEGAVKLVIDAMTFAVAANPVGYHAILMVVPCDGRFGKEDVESVKILKDIFGQDFIRFHGILLMTKGDNFQEENGPFEKWILSQHGPIRELTEECGNRVLLFDNRTKDMIKKKEQIRKLLTIIDNMDGKGTRYTSEIFNKGKEARDSLIKKSTKPKLKEETLIECGLINQQLARLGHDNPEEALDLLKSLKKRAEVLEQDIKEQDACTNSLSAAIFLAHQLKASISETTKTFNEILTMKQKIEQKELDNKMERLRFEEDEKRKKEDERKREKDLEKQRKEEEKQLKQMKREREQRVLEEEEKRKRERELKRQEEIEQLKKEQERLLNQMDEKIEKKLEDVRQNYETVKQEESWTWGSVASALAAPATSLVNWWFSK